MCYTAAKCQVSHCTAVTCHITVTCHTARVTVMCSLLWTTRMRAPVSRLQILRVASWLQEITSPAPVSSTPVTWGYTQCHSAGGDIVPPTLFLWPASTRLSSPPVLHTRTVLSALPVATSWSRAATQVTGAEWPGG